MTLVCDFQDLRRLEVTKGIQYRPPRMREFVDLHFPEEGLRDFVKIEIDYKGVIDYYTKRSELVRKSLKDSCSIEGLVRPVFTRTLNELKVSEWKLTDCLNNEDYLEVRKDLSLNILSSHDNFPIAECPYRGILPVTNFSKKAKIGWLIIATLPLGFPLLLQYDMNKSRRKRAEEVLSLDKNTDVYNEIRLADEILCAFRR